MNLEREILSILMQAGNRGLRLGKIARHVYNSCNSMFTPLDYKNVYGRVAQYINRNSKKPDSIILKCKEYGVYRINYKSYAMRQLMLNFSSIPDAERQEGGGAREKDEVMPLDLFAAEPAQPDPFAAEPEPASET